MKYNKEAPSFEFLPNEFGDADSYIARIAGQRLVGKPDYNYSNGKGRQKICIMQLSGIVVETTGLTQKEAKKAACAMMAPLIYGKHVEGKPIPLEYSIAAKLAAANGRPMQDPNAGQNMSGNMGNMGQNMGTGMNPNVGPGPSGAWGNQGPMGQPPPNMPMGNQMMHQQAWGNTGPPNQPPNMPNQMNYRNVIFSIKNLDFHRKPPVFLNIFLQPRRESWRRWWMGSNPRPTATK